MTTPAIFPYLPKNPAGGDFTLAPLMPLDLSLGSTSISVIALLDTGASTNVLPLDLGNRLGADWNKLTIPSPIGGSAGSIPGKALPLTARVATFPPVTLVFSWIASNSLPVILGQVNFFMEFDVCFFRSRGFFEVKPKSSTP